MEQRIAHACGHEQVHYIPGYASQQDRKVRWLQTTQCRTCFVVAKRSDEANAAVRDGAAIAHLDLPALVGSDRQVTWAATIRAKRLAAMLARNGPFNNGARHACLVVTVANWWIDTRDLTDVDLLARAEALAIGFGSPVA